MTVSGIISSLPSSVVMTPSTGRSPEHVTNIPQYQASGSSVTPKVSSRSLAGASLTPG